ncbi:MAG: hypothetical protein WCH40_12735 [Verrucomicrobiales bacterium]
MLIETAVLLSSTLFAVSGVPTELFAIVVVGLSIFSCLYVIGFVTDSSLPQQHLTARLVIGTLALMWIGFFTFVSLTGGTFVGLLNLAPYFLLKNLRA